MYFYINILLNQFLYINNIMGDYNAETNNEILNKYLNDPNYIIPEYQPKRKCSKVKARPFKKDQCSSKY